MLTGVILCLISLPGSLVGQQRSESEPDVATLLEQVSRPLLGAPYRLSPLGEGEGVDADPRFRLDAFDCTTLVETVVALALVERDKLSEASVLPILDRLRYLEGSPRFEHRAHLMTAQWLPHWRELGLLQDSTAEQTSGSVASVGLTFDETVWTERRIAEELDLPLEELPFGELELVIIPLDQVERALARAPAGQLVNVVRETQPGIPILISHQALLIDDRDGQRVVRHASQSLGRVADQTPAQFLRVLRSPQRWPVAGINLQRIRLVPASGLAPSVVRRE